MAGKRKKCYLCITTTWGHMAGVFATCKGKLTHAEEQREVVDTFHCDDQGVKELIMMLEEQAARQEKLPSYCLSTNTPLIKTELEKTRTFFADNWSREYSPDEGYYYQRIFKSPAEAEQWGAMCHALLFGKDLMQSFFLQKRMGELQRFRDGIWDKVSDIIVKMPEDMMHAICDIERIDLPGIDRQRNF